MRSRILYEDPNLYVVYKPAGLATQTSRVGEKDLVSELKNASKGGYVAVVHRLDQPVEGVLVFARTKQAAAKLNHELQQGSLGKEYLAAVSGRPEPAEGTLTDFLKKEGSLAHVTGADDPDGKESRLRYRVLETKETEAGPVSLVRICLETGRFHQIRAQFSHAGHPLLGDLKYGDEQSEKLSKILESKSVALCADRISFLHPITGEELQYGIRPEEKSFQYFRF